MKFKNPTNGYIQKNPCPWLWCFLFNWAYFVYKGAYSSALIVCAFSMATLGLAIFIMPFFARKLLRANYLQKGWVEVK